MNKLYNSLNMELQYRSESQATETKSTKTECNLSKSQQALKKCINEIGNLKEKNPITHNKPLSKLAAPKPMRARP